MPSFSCGNAVFCMSVRRLPHGFDRSGHTVVNLLNYFFRPKPIVKTLGKTRQENEVKLMRP